MKISQLWFSEISQTENLMREKRGKIFPKNDPGGVKLYELKMILMALKSNAQVKHGLGYWNNLNLRYKTVYIYGINLRFKTIFEAAKFNIHDIIRINKNKSCAPCP